MARRAGNKQGDDMSNHRGDFLSMNRRRLLGRSALLGGAAMALQLPAMKAALAFDSFEEGPVVDTTEGKVKGLIDGPISIFRGIRYGAPTGGRNRFMPAQKPAKYTGIVEAFSFGPMAPQFDPSKPRGNDPMNPIWPPLVPENEDCLRLNIYTPSTDRNAKKSVMVWYHGGGFSSGASSMPFYHGEGLAHHGDVVVVTINHRLNAFGFTYLADILGDEFAASGNVGILDGARALEWVRDNIAGFGGDPDNVTIFGESGGGAKVSTLMAMPAAHGLFHKAVVESGAGLSMTPADQATENAEKLLKAAGIDKTNARKLQDIPQHALTAAWLAARANFGPVVDGGALPRDPFSPDATPLSADVPLIIGTNRHEASFFFRNGGLNPKMTEAEMEKQLAGPEGHDVAAQIKALKKENPKATPWELFLIGASWNFMVTNSILMAERKSKQKAPVYMYRFDHEVPWKDGAVHAMHTAEIPFVFNNLKKNAWLVGDDAPQALADAMSGAWAAFAHTGDPNSKGLPKWPAYDAKKRATMIFNAESKVVNDPNPAERKAFMDLA